MRYNRMTRRHFLHGAGKSMLALPLLPSLMSTAEAQALPNSKCMVMFWTGHGGLQAENLYPVETNPAIASQLSSQSLYSGQGHNISYGSLLNMKTTRGSNLSGLTSMLGNDIDGMVGAAGYSSNRAGADFDNGQARISPIIGSFVSESHIAKMNLINGLDLMYDANHTNAQSGNYCNYNGNSLGAAGQTTTGMPNVWVPTIDAVIAKSSQFYGGSSPIARSTLFNCYYGGTGDIDGFISCERTASGIVPNSNAPQTVGAAFNLLFSSLKSASNTSVIDKKNFILNNVYQDYSRLARGAFGPGRRLGKEDRGRLEEFMTNLNSILSGVISGSGATCSIPGISASDKSSLTDGAFGNPIDSSTYPNILSLYNQIIAASFACGVCKIFIVGLPGLKDQFIPEGSVGATFSDGKNNTDSHQGLFHNLGIANRQQMLTESMRYFFQYGFYDLVQKLDATPATGGTLLDQSLLFWTHESGTKTHSGQSLPMITAGSAGGFFKTGKYVDFRHPGRPGFEYGKQFYQGIPYNRFLATAMQSMGLSASEYELSANLFAGTTGRVPVTSSGTVPGYGHPYQQAYTVGKDGTTPVFIYDYTLNDMSVPLPIIT